MDNLSGLPRRDDEKEREEGMMDRRTIWLKRQGPEYSAIKNEECKQYHKTLIGHLQLRAGRVNTSAKYRGQAGKITGSGLLAIWLTQNGLTSFDCRCAICGATVSDWEIDHIVPIAKGGSHDTENIQFLCKQCHVAKSRTEKPNEPMPSNCQKELLAG
jgi:5-methylcytosine-specific restriction endonuclease McrA